MYSHMQKTVCTKDQSLCLFPFDVCKSQKCCKSPECPSLLARMAKEKHGTIHQQPQVCHSRRRCNRTKSKSRRKKEKKSKHITECTKATRDSLTPWHSFKRKKKVEKDARSHCIWKWLMDESTPQRANRVAR